MNPVAGDTVRGLCHVVEKIGKYGKVERPSTSGSGNSGENAGSNGAVTNEGSDVG